MPAPSPCPLSGGRAETGSKRPRSPGRRRLIGTGYGIALVVAIALVLSLCSQDYYCSLCGASRWAVAVTPLGYYPRGLHVYHETRDTPLSRAVAPLMPEGRCHHKWVLFSVEQILFIYGGGHGGYRGQQRASGRFFAERIALIAQYDEELALAAVRALLYPYATGSEWDAKYREFNEVFVPWLDLAPRLLPECLVRGRELYGLPPKAGLGEAQSDVSSP